MRTAVFMFVAVTVASISLAADEPALPPGDTSPVLRLETGGPRSYVSGLAFSPDGAHLYATGWDKVVQVWNLNEQGRYEFSSGAALRVPTGAGLYGGLNALALSPDGRWLAVAGQGHTRDMSGERNVGWVLPAGVLSDAAQLDEGLIFVFDTQARQTTLLRGHRGPVQALAFVRGGKSNPPELVSVAEERVTGEQRLRPRVRFWNVKDSKEIASLESVPNAAQNGWEPLPALQGWRPGLTAWSTGADAKQARVALAWGDDQFRVWDVQPGQVSSSKSNPNILTVLPLSDAGDRLLTGAHAEVGIWSIPAASNGRLPALTQQQFRRTKMDSINGKQRNLPTAAAIIPGAKGSPARLALVVTRYLEDGRGEYRLVIASLDGTLQKEVELPWKGTIRQPALAASPDGRRLALAGNDRNEIYVYAVDDLSNARDLHPQILGSVGLAFQDAAFVRAENAWGLLLSQRPRTATGQFDASSLVLDIGQRQVEKNSDKWKLANANFEGWSAQIENPSTLSIQRAGQLALTIPMDDGYAITAYALCPPSPHCQVPLVAVASQLRGQPLLQLFRGDDGAPLRWCAGHTERIRALSFSDDGRMLVSVGDDRTVAVWTTTDLAQRTLNQHGRIPGLVVESQGDQIVVKEPGKSLAVQPGDEIVSLVRAGELVSFRVPKEFYHYILGRTPGENLELTVRRAGQIQSVNFQVGQAIDESKALFTVFVTPGKQDGQWEWIGWHPLGNFDSRGDDVERWLGWHFNTGEAEHPARFAQIGEYRDGFYRRNLLQSLIDAQKLVVTETEEKPQVSFWLRDQDGAAVRLNYYDRYEIRSPHVEVVADVTGVSERRIQSLEASIDDGAAVRFEHAANGEWTADLSALSWQRGRHSLKVSLKAADREVVRSEGIQFVPAAPAIVWQPNWAAEVKDETVTVRATINPSSEAAEVQLRAQLVGQNEKTVVRTWQTSQPLEISEPVAILPGENRLELVAWNANVPEAQRALESVQSSSVVQRAAPPSAPKVAMGEVQSISATGQQATLNSENEVFHTPWSQVRIHGRLTAEAALDKARLQLDAAENALARFQPGQAKEFELDETLTLTPGQHSVLVQADVAGQQTEKRLLLSYEPPTPIISSLEATCAPQKELPVGTASEPSVYYAGYHEPVAHVMAVLEGRLDQAYRVVLTANDSQIPVEQLEIDRTASDRHVVTAKVPLAGGHNVISLHVENDWSAPSEGRTLKLEYRRPPEILEVQADEVLMAKPLDLTCRIRSLIPVQLAKIVLDGGNEIPDVSIAPVPDAPGEWMLHAANIGIPEGEHVLRITAINEEGATLVPGVHKVRVEKPAEPPPELSLIQPVSSGAALTVNSAELELQFAVKSAAPAVVQLQILGDQSKFKKAKKTLQAERVPIDGTVAVEKIQLFEGVNEISLTALSSGGPSAPQTLKVAYVPTAVEVKILSLGGQRPQLRNDGRGEFQSPAPSAKQSLKGQVTGLNHVEKGTKLEARIWVNSFILPTVPVVLDNSQPNVGRFESDVTFNLPTRNKIRVEVFHSGGRVAAELGCSDTVEMDCNAPEREQDLYVLLLGEGDPNQLREGAKLALRAEQRTAQQGSQEVWKSDAFVRIYVHDALNVPPAVVQNRLRNLVGNMSSNLKRGANNSPQSIVMVYFQGQITLLDEDFAFGQVDPKNTQARAITGRILEGNLTRSYGAHLIFLDLQQNTARLEARDVWPRAPHLGIQVRNWNGVAERPDEARLFTVLQQTLPQARTIGEVARKNYDQFVMMRKKFPDQIEEFAQLDPVYELRISAVGVSD